VLAGPSLTPSVAATDTLYAVHDEPVKLCDVPLTVVGEPPLTETLYPVALATLFQEAVTVVPLACRLRLVTPPSVVVVAHLAPPVAALVPVLLVAEIVGHTFAPSAWIVIRAEVVVPGAATVWVLPETVAERLYCLTLDPPRTAGGLQVTVTLS
jgi:hypothetical protein